jgi:hypothetical protein
MHPTYAALIGGNLNVGNLGNVGNVGNEKPSEARH